MTEIIRAGWRPFDLPLLTREPSHERLSDGGRLTSNIVGWGGLKEIDEMRKITVRREEGRVEVCIRSHRIMKPYGGTNLQSLKYFFFYKLFSLSATSVKSSPQTIWWPSATKHLRLCLPPHCYSTVGPFVFALLSAVFSVWEGGSAIKETLRHRLSRCGTRRKTWQPSCDLCFWTPRMKGLGSRETE